MGTRRPGKRGSDDLRLLAHAASPGGPGRVAVAWTLAGGVTAGGLLVAAVTLSGELSSSLASSTTTILFTLGALAGLVHGSLLGYLARPLDRPRSEALSALALSFLMLLPAVPLAWMASVFVALSAASIRSGDVGLLAGAVAGWTVAVVICAWGAVEGWRAFRRAFVRWPERRTGTLITVGVLAVLGLVFFLDRPVIWGTDLQVRGIGAVLLALGATIWIAFPIVLASLHLLHRLTDGRRLMSPASPVEPMSRT